MSGYRIEHMALSVLKRWPTNPKTHAKEQLGASVARFGFIAPLLIDEGTGQLVAGHGRLEALETRKAAAEAPPENVKVVNGEWLVPVVRGVKFKSEAEAEAYLIADNRLTEKGGWNTQGLLEVLSSMPGANLEGSGFDAGDVKAMLKEASEAARPAGGKTPADLKAGFDAADTKQVTLYFEGARYDAFLERFEKAGQKLGAASPGETLVKLIERYEAELAKS